ncbi:MAG: hypothetical protein IPN17_28455 [Deltaproteobacteria bacterium]|nr:hypothetical protein [Deltaproteobacteria bacterium]
MALGCASTLAPLVAHITAPVDAPVTAAPVAVPLLDDALPANAVRRSVMDVALLAPVAEPLVSGPDARGWALSIVDGSMFLSPGARAQFALDPSRPVRSAEYEVPADLRAYVERVVVLASHVALPPDLDAELRRLRPGGDVPAEIRRRGRSAEARALTAALDTCPAGGTVTRVVLPTRDRARTGRRAPGMAFRVDE